MYSAQITKDRIKRTCSSTKTNMSSMLSACELGDNAIRQISDTKGMASFSLAKIADYLNCSVDYLLGRTDDPTNATLRGFNSLNSEGQSMVMEYIRVLMNDDKYRKVRTAPQQHSLEIAAFGGKGTEGAQPHGAPEITGN